MWTKINAFEFCYEEVDLSRSRLPILIFFWSPRPEKKKFDQHALQCVLVCVESRPLHNKTQCIFIVVCSTCIISKLWHFNTCRHKIIRRNFYRLNSAHFSIKWAHFSISQPRGLSLVIGPIRLVGSNLTTLGLECIKRNHVQPQWKMARQIHVLKLLLLWLIHK